MTYVSGTGRSIIAKAESSIGVAAGASGGKKIRRTAVNLNKQKDRYNSSEIRDDYQKVRASSGGIRVTGTLDGEISGGSYQDFWEAAMRQVAAATSAMTGLTLDVAGAGPTYTITRSSGSWITGGVRVGMVVRATLALNAASLNRNLLVTALTATVMTVYPLDAGTLTAETAVSGCTISVPGKRIIIPSTGHTEQSFTIEDLLSSTISRLFIGVEVGSINCDLSPGQNAKVQFGFTGLGGSNSTSPYFTSPAALGETPALSGPRSVILQDGEVIPCFVQLTYALNNGLSTEPVIGSTSAAAIGQGPTVGTGQITNLLRDNDLFDKFDNDTPFEIVTYMYESTDGDSEFVVHHLPDCLLNDASVDDGEKLLKVSSPFSFTKKPATAGYDATTFAVQDSQYA